MSYNIPPSWLCLSLDCLGLWTIENLIGLNIYLFLFIYSLFLFILLGRRGPRNYAIGYLLKRSRNPDRTVMKLTVSLNRNQIIRIWVLFAVCFCDFVNLFSFCFVFLVFSVAFFSPTWDVLCSHCMHSLFPT